MRKLLASIVASALGLWLATIIVPQVQVKLLPSSSFFGLQLTALWQAYLLLGIVIGLLFYFAKPILDIAALPLKIITLGLFGLIIDAALIWVVAIIFPELSIPLWLPLIYTVFIIGVANFLLSLVVGKE
jgi:putative membrane protein